MHTKRFDTTQDYSSIYNSTPVNMDSFNDVFANNVYLIHITSLCNSSFFLSCIKWDGIIFLDIWIDKIIDPIKWKV